MARLFLLLLMCGLGLTSGAAWGQVQYMLQKFSPPVWHESVDTTGLLIKPTAKNTYLPVANHCFLISQEQPCFKEGGSAGLQRFLSQHLRCPAILLRSNLEGATTVRFVIDAEGKIRNPTIYKSLDPAWDEEVLRVINLLNGRFEPATYNGQPFDTCNALSVPFIVR